METELGDIRLDMISRTEWRVCDRRMPASSHLSVLGFVEKTGEGFEVTKLSQPLQVQHFDSLIDATVSFVPALQQTARD